MHRFEYVDKNNKIFVFDMSKKDIEKSIHSLESLIKKAEEDRIEHLSIGICSNWGSAYSYALVKFYGASWDKSAFPEELIDYPVPMNHTGRKMWEGTQKALRIDLMEYILSNLRQVLEDM